MIPPLQQSKLTEVRLSACYSCGSERPMKLAKSEHDQWVECSDCGIIQGVWNPLLKGYFKPSRVDYLLQKRNKPDFVSTRKTGDQH